jgi:hypothetical protein
MYLDSLTDTSQSNLRVHYITGNEADLSLANLYVHRHGTGIYFIDEVWALDGSGQLYTDEYEGTLGGWVTFSLIFNYTGTDTVVSRYQGGVLQWQKTFNDTAYGFQAAYYGAFGDGSLVTDYKIIIDDISVTDKMGTPDGTICLEEGFEASFPNISGGGLNMEDYNWYMEGDVCPSTTEVRTGTYALEVPRVGGFARVSSNADLTGDLVEFEVDAPREPGFGNIWVTPWNVTTVGSHTWSVPATWSIDGQTWVFKDWVINGTVSGTSRTKTLNLPVGSTTTIYIEYKASASGGGNPGGEHPVLPPPQNPPPQSTLTGDFEAWSRVNPLYWVIPDTIPEPWRSGIADAMTLIILAYVGTSLAASFYPPLASKKKKKRSRRSTRGH